MKRLNWKFSTSHIDRTEKKCQKFPHSCFIIVDYILVASNEERHFLCIDCCSESWMWYPEQCMVKDIQGQITFFNMCNPAPDMEQQSGKYLHSPTPFIHVINRITLDQIIPSISLCGYWMGAPITVYHASVNQADLYLWLGWWTMQQVFNECNIISLDSFYPVWSETWQSAVSSVMFYSTWRRWYN